MATWSIDEAVALSLGRDPKNISWDYIRTIEKVSAFAAEYAAAREIVVRAKAMGLLWEDTIPALFVSWARRIRFPLSEALGKAVDEIGLHVVDWKDMYDRQSVTLAAVQLELEKEQNKVLALMKEHNVHIDRMGEKQKAVFGTYNELLRRKDETIDTLSKANIQLAGEVVTLEKALTTHPRPDLSVRERDSLLKLLIGIAIDAYGYDPKASRSPTAKDLAGILAERGLSIDEDIVRKYLTEAKELLPGDLPE